MNLRQIVYPLLACLAVSSCSQDAKPPRQKRERPERPARVVPVEIVSLEPAEIEVRDGQVVPTRFTLEYRIANPETVKKATLEVYAKGVGNIKSQDLPVRNSNTVTFLLAPPHADLGPEIRFRATCPDGVTEWHTLGQEPPLPSEVRESAELKIDSVSPDSINLNGRLMTLTQVPFIE